MQDLSFRLLDAADKSQVERVFRDDGGFSERVNGREFIRADMNDFFVSVPPGVVLEQKLILGAFAHHPDSEDQLVAVADVVSDWPDKGTAYIGLLQVKASEQGRGIAREVHQELRRCLPNFNRWRLAVIDTNPQAMGFWEALGYKRTGEEKPWTGSAGVTRTAVIFESPTSGTLS